MTQDADGSQFIILRDAPPDGRIIIVSSDSSEMLMDLVETYATGERLVLAEESISTIWSWESPSGDIIIIEVVTVCGENETEDQCRDRHEKTVEKAKERFPPGASDE